MNTKTILMLKHQSLTAKGKYIQARYILRLLINGHVALDLSDDAWFVEDIFTRLGLKWSVNRTYTTATYYFRNNKGRNRNKQ